MKKFLLLIGILLCLQSCAFARNLRVLGNGLYVDLDSISRNGNYAYALLEFHSGNSPFHLFFLNEFDLLNYKSRTIKGYGMDSEGKIIDVREGLEVPNALREWNNIPENSPFEVLLEMIKKL